MTSGRKRGEESVVRAGAKSFYVVPYRTLLRQLELDPEELSLDTTVSLERIHEIIRILLRSVPVDETWYRTEYKDVEAAIQSGVFASAKQHFLQNGYFEGRKPGRAIVDENWYLATYPDVKDAIDFGEIESCQQHFDQFGEEEGRAPHE